MDGYNMIHPNWRNAMNIKFFLRDYFHRFRRWCLYGKKPPPCEGVFYPEDERK